MQTIAEQIDPNPNHNVAEMEVPKIDMEVADIEMEVEGSDHEPSTNGTNRDGLFSMKIVNGNIYKRAINAWGNHQWYLQKFGASIRKEIVKCPSSVQYYNKCTLCNIRLSKHELPFHLKFTHNGGCPCDKCGLD